MVVCGGIQSAVSTYCRAEAPKRESREALQRWSNDEGSKRAQLSALDKTDVSAFPVKIIEVYVIC